MRGNEFTIGASRSAQLFMLALQSLRNLLLLAFVGFMVLGQLPSRIEVMLCIRKPLDCLAHVLVVTLRLRTRFGRQQHARARSHHTMCVGTQFEPFPSAVFPTLSIRDARQIAEIELRQLMVARQLRLNLLRRVVHHQVIASARTT
ncbi:hypothetical protein BLA34_12740 [Ralstonia solanacearum]|nr:hypothetical protein BLA34_12740 [Ralstonia solanacearum]